MSSTFRAIWPIQDDDATIDQLITEAQADLPRLLAAERVRATDDGTWRILPGQRIPGSGGAEIVLVADFIVEHEPKNARIYVDDVEWMVRHGADASECSRRLGVQPESIRKHLRRHGRDDLADRLFGGLEPVGLGAA
jgi:hypothetical protein